MTHALPIDASRRALDAGWRMTSTAPGAWATPADIAANAEWLEAIVPGTVAATLLAHGRWSEANPTPLHDRDHWYRLTLDVAGRRRLRFDGLATTAQVFLDGELILDSRSMFLAHEIDVDLRPGAELAVVFRSLARVLDGVKPKRARWRTRLVPEQRLRAVRTTLLGHMPGWAPPIDVVGPFRAITLSDPATDPIRSVRLDTAFDGRDGRLAARLVFEEPTRPAAARLLCADCEAPLVVAADGALVAEMPLAGIAPWWPATHGDPVLHDVEAEIDGVRFRLGRVGFRALSIDRGADGRGFGLLVNDVPVFARGVNWLPVDMIGLSSDRAALADDLARLAAAGCNMVRVPGIATYEAEAFHSLCDELGLLVWQDLMFANFDYPAGDPDFVALAETEATQVGARLARHPSSAVVCGGSEITQQAAMMGLPPASWGSALFDAVLPAAVGTQAPHLPWVRSTPDGGAMPFVADVGVTHYYGVGAYGRPLDDARRANVRFAAECLAFACVPEEKTVSEHLAMPPVHSPAWKAGVPRDLGAGWDFEDVREVYERMIFRIDPPALRWEDPQAYLDLARATVDHVIEETMREWRRPGSSCRGALVFTGRDPKIGAGWGLVDAVGRAKSAFHALARASAPIAVLVSDEGVNGLDVHLLNETATPVAGRIELTALAEGRRPVVTGSRDVEVPARGSLTFAATELFGAFFDTTRAYRFGPAAHDLTHARLVDAAGETLAEAFHRPLGRTTIRRRVGLTARVERVGGDFDLVIGCEEAVASVRISDDNFTAADGFHMAPGEKRLRLVRRPEAAADAVPDGHVRALDARERATYRG